MKNKGVLIISLIIICLLCAQCVNVLIKYDVNAFEFIKYSMPVSEFMPYAFMNLLNPVFAIVITYLGIGIKYKEEDGKNREEVKALKAARKAEK